MAGFSSLHDLVRNRRAECASKSLQSRPSSCNSQAFASAPQPAGTSQHGPFAAPWSDRCCECPISASSMADSDCEAARGKSHPARRDGDHPSLNSRVNLRRLRKALRVGIAGCMSFGLAALCFCQAIFNSRRSLVGGSALHCNQGSFCGNGGGRDHSRIQRLADSQRAGRIGRNRRNDRVETRRVGSLALGPPGFLCSRPNWWANCNLCKANRRENSWPDQPNLTTVGMQEQLAGSGYCHNELRSASLLGFHADRALVPVNHDVVTDRQP